MQARKETVIRISATYYKFERVLWRLYTSVFKGNPDYIY